mmetsp:Transcript_13736/g.37144  ORF Transcript_13736/g.37144 Transcript_13736/m.37144 type:complete len:225 (+) Transcript_13736:488-1162(+)
MRVSSSSSSLTTPGKCVVGVGGGAARILLPQTMSPAMSSADGATKSSAPSAAAPSSSSSSANRSRNTACTGFLRPATTDSTDSAPNVARNVTASVTALLRTRGPRESSMPDTMKGTMSPCDQDALLTSHTGKCPSKKFTVSRTPKCTFARSRLFPVASTCPRSICNTSRRPTNCGNSAHTKTHFLALSCSRKFESPSCSMAGRSMERTARRTSSSGTISLECAA